MYCFNSYPVTLPKAVGVRGTAYYPPSVVRFRRRLAMRDWHTFGCAFEKWCHLQFNTMLTPLIRGFQASIKLRRRKGFKIVSVKLYQSLIAQECVRCGLQYEEVIGLGRRNSAARARARVWRDLLTAGASLPAIGTAAGRDHTTILYGIRRVNFEDGVGPRPVHPSQRIAA